ncbi:hypothetical protein TDB9533_02424 [Thalassocella blandensis]|nr:hypothetical protein TDB9533_02424 [Thalassocella blandensis]
MNHILTWCEIPVTDMRRAKAFYAEVLDISFIEQEMDGHQLAIFESEPDNVTGSLVMGEKYQPSETATIVYLNAGQDLTGALQRAEQQGGKVIWPKSPIGDGSNGYFAQFTDLEGNRVGLYSLQ